MAEEIIPLRCGHLELGDQKIWWEYHGQGNRETVCLLNGLAMHTRAWYGFLPLLTESYDVILYDYQGQGQSSKDDIPYLIPEFARYLCLIMDELGLSKIHLMGISYGGFIGLDFARLYQERLHTLMLSGILLSHEKLFSMYQDISLRFYRGSEESFELYTHYMYEKIFGEGFVSTLTDEKLGAMRQRFYDRYLDHRHCLIRLTEAQNPAGARILICPGAGGSKAFSRRDRGARGGRVLRPEPVSQSMLTEVFLSKNYLLQQRYQSAPALSPRVAGWTDEDGGPLLKCRGRPAVDRRRPPHKGSNQGSLPFGER